MTISELFRTRIVDVPNYSKGIKIKTHEKSTHNRQQRLANNAYKSGLFYTDILL